MNWHIQTKKQSFDIRSFEKTCMDSIGLIEEIVPRYRSTFFNHIFSGGYSAGYYAYSWAEVLDADAFEAFEEKGIFDSTTAMAFRKCILERGDSEDPMILYRKFRGADPNPEAFLKRRGL
jgi:peptidyl-dipeptidase Dcp